MDEKLYGVLVGLVVAGSRFMREYPAPSKSEWAGFRKAMTELLDKGSAVFVPIPDQPKATLISAKISQ